MKKLLLGSTALVVGGLMAAPAMAADPIKIGVGGYYQFYALGAASVEPMPRTARRPSTRVSSSSRKVKSISSARRSSITAPRSVSASSSKAGTPAGRHWHPPDRRSLSCSPSATGAASNSARRTMPYIMYYGTPSALLGFGFFQHNTNFSWTNPRPPATTRPRSTSRRARSAPSFRTSTASTTTRPASRACRLVSATRRRST